MMELRRTEKESAEATAAGERQKLGSPRELTYVHSSGCTLAVDESFGHMKGMRAGEGNAGMKGIGAGSKARRKRSILRAQ